MPESPARSWWTDYFDDVYLRVYEPLLPSELTENEVDAIRELLGDRPGARILDVACGWGRHTIELARCGYDVTGVDLSTFLLGEAGSRASAAGVEARFVRADMLDLPFANEFDAAICLFSSLGYSDDTADARALVGIRRALCEEGVFILQTMHRDAIARGFAERDWWTTPDGDTVRVEREFDPVAGISHETLHWRDASGTEGEKRHSVRVRSATEWNALLVDAGFRPLEWFGDWTLEPLGLQSEELIVMCEVGPVAGRG